MTPSTKPVRHSIASDSLKQAIILRADLGMGKGKLVAQGSHASLLAFEKALTSREATARQWAREGSKKIVLKVNSEGELGSVFHAAKAAGLPCVLVIDAGHTQVDPGTATAVGIGPASETEIDRITGNLKLL
jgi:PTH2 family peptidyl-tRNA hydrolase